MSAPRGRARRAWSPARGVASGAALTALAIALLGCSSSAEDDGPTSTESESARSTAPDSLAEATGTADATPTPIAAPTVERRLGCSDLDVSFTNESLQSAGLTVGGPAGGEVFSADCLWATEPDLTAEEARAVPGTVSALALTASDMDFADIKSRTLEEAGEVSEVEDGPDGVTFITRGDGFVRAEVLLPDTDGYVDCTWTQAETTADYMKTVRTLCLDFRDLVGQARTEAYAARSESGSN